MFGTAASLAGIQNRLNASMRNCATNSQTRLSTIGIEAKSAKRMTSVMTIVLRRSNRSAMAPARGPRTIAGSSRNSSTPPRAKLAAANPSTSEVAVAVIASSPSQSPKLDRDIDPQLAEVTDPQDRPELGPQADGPYAFRVHALVRGRGDRGVRRRPRRRGGRRHRRTGRRQAVRRRGDPLGRLRLDDVVGQR